MSEGPADYAVVAACFGVALALFGAEWWAAGLMAGVVFAAGMMFRERA